MSNVMDDRESISVDRPPEDTRRSRGDSTDSDSNGTSDSCSTRPEQQRPASHANAAVSTDPRTIQHRQRPFYRRLTLSSTAPVPSARRDSDTAIHRAEPSSSSDAFRRVYNPSHLRPLPTVAADGTSDNVTQGGTVGRSDANPDNSPRSSDNERASHRNKGTKKRRVSTKAQDYLVKALGVIRAASPALTPPSTADIAGVTVDTHTSIRQMSSDRPADAATKSRKRQASSTDDDSRDGQSDNDNDSASSSDANPRSKTKPRTTHSEPQTQTQTQSDNKDKQSKHSLDRSATKDISPSMLYTDNIAAACAAVNETAELLDAKRQEQKLLFQEQQRRLMIEQHLRTSIFPHPHTNDGSETVSAKNLSGALFNGTEDPLATLELRIAPHTSIGIHRGSNLASITGDDIAQSDLRHQNKLLQQENVNLKQQVLALKQQVMELLTERAIRDEAAQRHPQHQQPNREDASTGPSLSRSRSATSASVLNQTDKRDEERARASSTQPPAIDTNALGVGQIPGGPRGFESSIGNGENAAGRNSATRAGSIFPSVSHPTAVDNNVPGLLSKPRAAAATDNSLLYGNAAVSIPNVSGNADSSPSFDRDLRILLLQQRLLEQSRDGRRRGAAGNGSSFEPTADSRGKGDEPSNGSNNDTNDVGPSTVALNSAVLRPGVGQGTDVSMNSNGDAATPSDNTIKPAAFTPGTATSVSGDMSTVELLAMYRRTQQHQQLLEIQQQRRSLQLQLYQQEQLLRLRLEQQQRQHQRLLQLQRQDSAIPDNLAAVIQAAEPRETVTESAGSNTASGSVGVDSSHLLSIQEQLLQQQQQQRQPERRQSSLQLLQYLRDAQQRRRSDGR